VTVYHHTSFDGKWFRTKHVTNASVYFIVIHQGGSIAIVPHALTGSTLEGTATAQVIPVILGGRDQTHWQEGYLEFFALLQPS
jgi:hypothetical protein